MATIKDAAKKLPVKSRRAFLRLWESAGCMDIYEGDLVMYLAVIDDVLKDRERRLKKISEVLVSVNKVLEKYTISS